MDISPKQKTCKQPLKINNGYVYMVVGESSVGYMYIRDMYVGCMSVG